MALERDGELAPILSSLAGIRIERLRAPEVCQRRTLAERAAYRTQAFARYFITAAKHALPLARLRLIGLGPDWPSGRVTLESAALTDRIVGLRDASGRDLGLGLLRDVDPAAGQLTLLSPLRDLGAITTLAVGSVRWPES